MPSLVSSLQSVAKAAIAYSQLVVVLPETPVHAGSPPVCSNPGLSCQTSNVRDTCCVNAPGGLLLLTQFWDTTPVTGPVDSWTVHGLWPDNCDGTYESYCDPSRQYSNITSIIEASGRTALLDYMSTYWKDYKGDDEDFWEHEWNKHGTCISTLEPNCYTNYAPQQDVVDYFQKTVDLFKELNSYQILSDAGIVPSESRTYTAAAINAALKAFRGVEAKIQCDKGELNEIWYFYHVRGSLQTGTFIPTKPDGAKSDCPATGIRYLPKTGSRPSPPRTTTKSGPAPTGAPGGPFSGRGTLLVTSGGQQNGCIISGGTWYTSGACATFTATARGSGFTLTSSKGKCAVRNNVLTCSAAVSAPTVFSNEGGLLASAAGSTWYTNAVPSGTKQAPVSAAKLAISLTISWNSS